MAELTQLPGSPSNPDLGGHHTYIEPAPLVEVMFDQLEYLAAHGGHGCLPGCPDCARLEQVAALLLVPFHGSQPATRAA